MLAILVAILAGFVLLAGRMHMVPGIGAGLDRAARALEPFGVVIGVVAIVLGILEFLSLEGILLILAGLILAVNALRAIPSVGPSLARLGRALAEFSAVIGVIILLIGLIDLVEAVFGRLGR